GERLELNGVGSKGERIVLLLVEELLAERIDHSRRLLRPEHRVRINLHPLPAWRIGNIVGVPPLHFHVHQRSAGAPCHRNTIRRHFTRAGGPLMEAVGIARREHNRACLHCNVFAGYVVEAEHAADGTVSFAQKRGSDGFLESWDAGTQDLLAPQVHERHAGIALHICRYASYRTRAGHDVAVVVTPEIKTELLELRIIGLLDPCATSPRPLLIDQELIVVLDQEFSGVAGVCLTVAERPAGNHQVAGEQRGPALADKAFANDERLDAALAQIKGCVTAGGTAAYYG